MSSCPHSSRPAPSSASVAQAMTFAQARCEAAGEKWTPPRQRTYALLAAAPGPMKAYDLIRHFGASSGAAKPPTVYRSLDLLMGLGLVHKVASLSAYVVCAADAPHTSTNFLVCECCHAVEELADLGSGMVAEDAARSGYAVDHIALELRGRCLRCR